MDDGGWSRGMPAKGSGWNSKNKSHNLPTRDTLKAGNQVVDWGGSPEVDSAAVWPVSDHKHQGSNGSGEGEGWNTFSPGQSNSSRQHSQPENWMSDEGSLCMGDNACSQQSNSSPPSSNVDWNLPSDVPTCNIQHELEPIEGDELDDEIPENSNIMRDTIESQLGSLQQYKCEDQDDSRISNNTEETIKNTSSLWDDSDSLPTQNNDNDTLDCVKQSLSSSTYSDDRQHSKSRSPLGGSKNSSCSPSADVMEKNINNETDADATDKEETLKQNDDDLTAVTISHAREVASNNTPDGSGLGMSVWKSRPSVGGSTSSINSAGSNSSWKSEGKNGAYHSKPLNLSPRKCTRYVPNNTLYMYIHVLYIYIYMFCSVVYCLLSLPF